MRLTAPLNLPPGFLVHRAIRNRTRPLNSTDTGLNLICYIKLKRQKYQLFNSFSLLLVCKLNRWPEIPVSTIDDMNLPRNHETKFSNDYHTVEIHIIYKLPEGYNLTGCSGR